MSVIGFLRDITGLFNWNTDDNPTSERDYMNAVKNWHETEKNLVDSVLWQPKTKYDSGSIVETPSISSARHLYCVRSGRSGSVEPLYDDYTASWTAINDGTVKWVVVPKPLSFRVRNVHIERTLTCSSGVNSRSINLNLSTYAQQNFGDNIALGILGIKSISVGNDSRVSLIGFVIGDDDTTITLTYNSTASISGGILATIDLGVYLAPKG